MPDRITRRDVLQMLAAAAPVTALGSCCTLKYPGRIDPREALASRARGDAAALTLHRGVLGPFADDAPKAADVRLSIADPHAHFFNAADVPVKGFVQECIGHSAPRILQPLVAAAALIADRIAQGAPTAAQEIEELKKIAKLAPRGADAPQRASARAEAKAQTEKDRDDAASRLVKVLREKDGQRFEREYLRLKRDAERAAAADPQPPRTPPTPRRRRSPKTT